MNLAKKRNPSCPIADIFLNRWSPRAMSGESISTEELMPLFEAARWAPSSYNEQPWRFIYTHKNSPIWKTLFELLVPQNQNWAKNAAVLVVLISKKNYEYNNKPAPTHSFDSGAAWMSLALQATLADLAVRAIGGFDYEKARKVLHIPDEFKIEIMIAIGKPVPKEKLPLELQAKEMPSSRKPLEEIVFEDMFK